MRSTFLRYIIAFAAIIIVSFLMLSSIISVSIDDYAIDEKRGDVELVSQITSALIGNEFRNSEFDDFVIFANESKSDISTILNTLSPYAQDMSFLITDKIGMVVASCIRTDGIGQIGNIPSPIMEDFLTNNTYAEHGKLGNTLSAAHLICAMPIFDETRTTVVGAVFACSSTASANALVNVMNKSIMLSNLWIMLAVMVAVYFITERLISPLREMRQAAKNFAKGNFDTRIRVVGNDEVAELAETFNNMAESLAKSENLRSSFLANVSHDLRTPMTTIAGYIDGILEGAIPPEKQNYYLQIVSGEIRRLSRLVSKILDLSRMEAGMRKFSPIEFDICELARLILISFESKIDEKHLEVDFSIEEDRMQVYADKDAFHQILYNICENAIKFSKDGGCLRIAIRTASEKGKYEVEVYNEGAGIPEEDLPYIFDRFYKTDKSRGLDKIGVGLGLYIVKTMLNANGESIVASSKEGEYCSFTFTIKRAEKA